jgi:adenylate cyclase
MSDITHINSIDVEPIVDWLTGGARSATTAPDILQQLCEKLVACGVQLDRVTLFVRTLHPNVMGRSFRWKSDADQVEVIEAAYSILETDDYVLSPVRHIREQNSEVRRIICNKDCPNDYPVLAGLKDEGFTDYLMSPMEFTDGELHAVSWVTRKASGFSDMDIKAIRRIVPALTRLTEIMATKRVARNLLDAYLGPEAGAKVLAGNIKLGDGEDIFAVIWFCDLRGSTPLAESMSRSEFLSLLNSYFDCMAGAVTDGGGEVLRFIGDAALAIFPAGEDGADVARACEMAAEAARDAIGRMRTLNDDRLLREEPELEFGIGLHLGNVMYGNIGTPTRIEFSVIGSAANEAARIEGLCKGLEQNLLISEDVVKHLSGEWLSLGSHDLRGVGEPIEIFTTIAST